MTSTLAQEYLEWLAPQLRPNDGGDPARGYFGLASVMAEREFEVVVPRDDNRVGDGRDLRLDFCRYLRIPSDVRDELGPCSFLEVLIGLSRRLAFAAGGSSEGWAWQLVTNLELHRMWDPIGRAKAQKIAHILDRCIRREYEPNGQGGFFPLAWPDEDQRQVELWYQMSAYIGELHHGGN